MEVSHHRQQPPGRLTASSGLRQITDAGVPFRCTFRKVQLLHESRMLARYECPGDGHASYEVKTISHTIWVPLVLTVIVPRVDATQSPSKAILFPRVQ